MDHVGKVQGDLPADDLAAARLFLCPAGCGFVSSAENLYWQVMEACPLPTRCRSEPRSAAEWRVVQEQLEAEGPGSQLPL